MSQYLYESVDIDRLLWGVWGGMLLLALSGLYPARALSASPRPAVRVSFWVVTGLVVAVPPLVMIFDRMRLDAIDRTIDGGLQNMPMPMSQLPFMYVFCAAIAALIFWVVFAWHRRMAA